MNENDEPTKFLWLDLEMTGLNPVKQRIIEVAVVVTDAKLDEIDTYEAVIHQTDDDLKFAEKWPRENMKDLFAESAKSMNSEADVEAKVLDLVIKHFGDEPAVLAGNSIHQDRRFIRQWWPKLESKLHYRMLDVSSFKLWLQASQGMQYEKNEVHRAMDDIRESIIELKWCLKQLSSQDNKDYVDGIEGDK